MQFVIQENFTAQPFIGSSGIPLNVAPKDFIKGTTIDATEQMNAARQMIWVSSDGYALDMSKVSAALNPNLEVMPTSTATSTTPISTPITLQVFEGFTATPFVYDISIPSALPPKIFVTGQHIEAQQRLNSLQQPLMVTTDGYVVDMSKVNQLNYPQYYPQYPTTYSMQYQPPMGYYAPRRQQQELQLQQNALPIETSTQAKIGDTINTTTETNTTTNPIQNKNLYVYIIIAIVLTYFLLVKKPVA